ncbi:MAG: outer membrane lipoprotein-sorting protein [Deltaproteobacteria bacterium]|nr:outer membrane lipoprotein-sorting protein [Deltaproteobacteria bacterium]
MVKLLSIVPVLALALVAAPSARADLSQDEMVKILGEIDLRQKAVNDFKAHAFIQAKEAGKEDIAYETVFYRRGGERKFLILFLGPKAEAGKGYLRIDDNLWMYTPSTGKWERRTERDRIAGTDSRRSDFDESRLAEEYVPTFVGEGQLGKFKTWKLKLTAKADKDVAWPVIELDVDQASGNVLQRIEFALSGKPMRKSLYAKWVKVADPRGKEVWYAREMYFFDLVETANETRIKIEAVDLTDLPANLFTKAWLESKSR